jgi:hypothetical protein
MVPLCSPRGEYHGDNYRSSSMRYAMARRAEDDHDKALWLTLAQSWVRLAKHVERSASGHYLELEAERAR